MELLNIKQLFEDDKQYIVPIYQRDYAWTHKEAKQLIDDIRDYIVDNKERSYYIGSLVVYSKGDNLYEVVDGQQRLTTLTIMLRALKSKGVEIDSKLTNAKLSFEHRAQSTNSLKNLGEGDTSIDEMYHILQKANYGHCNEFTEYLLEKVKILLVEIPKDTDLNHYFEIMNTRGEQLEKHEVLKARLMSMLKYDDEEMRTTAHSLFNILWEACADMDSYVMMNIKADIRKVLYGDNGSNVPLDSDFDSMLNQIIENGKQSGANNKITIEKIEKEAVNIAKVIEDFWGKNKNLEGYEIARDAQNNEKPERFKSIIDFQNFLLQALSIYVKIKGKEVKITLDDKQLLQSFEKVENALETYDDKTSFAKEFIVFLLRVRSLFDIYVLKSDSKDDNDGKYKIQKYDRSNYYYINTFESKSSENEFAETNSDLEMIQSMFHFSHTSNTYNNWLNDTLSYIVEKIVEKRERLTSVEFYDWLWKLAKSYMLENYLKSDEGYDFSRLDRGCEVENFVFNFYDFVVWKKNKDTYKDFKFTYRTSVEHFYPQHPKDNKYLYEDNSDSAKDPKHKVHQKTVNSFGNLCLITSSMNSRFSNLMPNAKYDQYGADNKDVGKQSIKLMQMFEMAKEKSTWNKKTIEDFTKDCKKTLADELGIEDNCQKEQSSEKTCSNPS